MFDRRLIQNFDWGLCLIVLSLTVVGGFTVYSAVTAGPSDPQKSIYYKQLIWYGIGLMVMTASFVVSYKSLDRWSPVLYGTCLLLLVAVLVFGKQVGGSRRWLALGPASFQPSEPVKIAVILMLSRMFSKTATEEGFTFRELIQPLCILIPPFLLIVRQPDLGTGMMLVLITGSMTLFAKIERKTLITIMSAGVLGVPLVWHFLKGYQKQRILTFLNPDRDPLGAGYHIIQSKIAIGSGMFTGKGYLKGTQNALAFLPEQQTDFIFSVLAEEWGFLGCLVVLFLFLLLLIWGLNIAFRSRDLFGTFLAFGLTCLIFWQVFINMGMVMGLMPVVGVPLPFISYGGSSFLTLAVCIGLLLNISMRRFMVE